MLHHQIVNVTCSKWAAGGHVTEVVFLIQIISPQLTVVHLVTYGMDLWQATLALQMIQRCSTAVTQVWFQRGEWELCALGMGGVQTLLIWAAL